ncbi:MAG: glycoside hydrolase family 172 protein [Armatimonadota bacterium]
MKVWLMILLCLAVAVPAFGAQMTYVDLVKRYTDLEGLAALPVVGEKCRQASSYDRASRYDEATGKYVAWDANGDGGGVIRMEGDEAVFAEMNGPGCIWRMWSALAGRGHLKIYLDDAPEPVLDMPFHSYFDNSVDEFNLSSLVNTVSQGRNWYVPIPYQKSCKIVADKDWGAYFQFTYTTFPKDTIVPTFKKNVSQEDLAALKQTDRFLRYRLGRDPAGVRKGETAETKFLTLAPGSKNIVTKLTGPRAITSIRLAIDPAWGENAEKQLREVVLKISWDGEKQPSVWVPLGDFFGAAPGIQKYKSLPMGVTDKEMYCLWYMPFAKDAKIELQNGGDKAFPVTLSIVSAPLSRDINDLMRFHAKWHRDAFLPTESERAIDWTMLKTNGQGRFVGVMLDVRNPKGGWWGEGDEKFFVDGEKFPSTFGTGSEDYFGYAWCSPDYFQNAFHNQTRQAPDNKWASLNRWQIADCVPFQKSFEGDIEKYWPNDRPTLYACTAYWYLALGGQDAYEPVEPASARTNYCPLDVTK